MSKPEQESQPEGQEPEFTAEERAALAIEELLEEARQKGQDPQQGPPEWYRKVYDSL